MCLALAVRFLTTGEVAVHIALNQTLWVLILVLQFVSSKTLSELLSLFLSFLICKMGMIFIVSSVQFSHSVMSNSL